MEGGRWEMGGKPTPAEVFTQRLEQKYKHSTSNDRARETEKDGEKEIFGGECAIRSWLGKKKLE